MKQSIVVINPNSSEIVTESLREALAGFMLSQDVEIECVTITEGPPGVVTQREVDEAALNVAKVVEARPDAGAFVIACYSQPGVDLARSLTGAPVYGIQDAGALTALSLADNFGVIAVSELSIPRHLRTLRRLGIEQRLVGEVALAGNMSVAESGHGEESFAGLLRAGKALKIKGAGAIVLGCAGMSGHRERLERELSLPVIDPTQAAVSMAFGYMITKHR